MRDLHFLLYLLSVPRAAAAVNSLLSFIFIHRRPTDRTNADDDNVRFLVVGCFMLPLGKFLPPLLLPAPSLSSGRISEDGSHVY